MQYLRGFGLYIGIIGLLYMGKAVWPQATYDSNMAQLKSQRQGK